MKSPIEGGYEWLVVNEIDSTQMLASDIVREGRNIGIVLSHHQLKGVGRFGRPWISGADDSLTATMIFRAYPSHPRPHLIGMTLAIAAASAIKANLQWPNDLTIGGRKVGGILTELVPAPDGALIPVVGIGVNLNQTGFPDEIAERATSLRLGHGGDYAPRDVAQSIVDRLTTLPEPDRWADIASIWNVFDATPGKKYKLPNGNVAIAIAVGSDGQLLCTVNGESHAVLAGEAIFG